MKLFNPVKKAKKKVDDSLRNKVKLIRVIEKKQKELEEWNDFKKIEKEAVIKKIQDETQQALGKKAKIMSEVKEYEDRREKALEPLDNLEEELEKQRQELEEEKESLQKEKESFAKEKESFIEKKEDLLEKEQELIERDEISSKKFANAEKLEKQAVESIKKVNHNWVSYYKAIEEHNKLVEDHKLSMEADKRAIQTEKEANQKDAEQNQQFKLQLIDRERSLNSAQAEFNRKNKQ